MRSAWRSPTARGVGVNHYRGAASDGAKPRVRARRLQVCKVEEKHVTNELLACERVARHCDDDYACQYQHSAAAAAVAAAACVTEAVPLLIACAFTVALRCALLDWPDAYERRALRVNASVAI
uniref:Uncharacterized protein n=1 Tax=Plectus sambesii TaxID=2011161 RepID=A0A914VXT8_9BILA